MIEHVLCSSAVLCQLLYNVDRLRLGADILIAALYFPTQSEFSNINIRNCSKLMLFKLPTVRSFCFCETEFIDDVKVKPVSAALHASVGKRCVLTKL